MRLLRFMGQEGLGNPTREARYSIEQMRKMLAKRAPELVEERIMAVVVFLADQVNLNVGETEIPVLRGAKLKGFLRSIDQPVLSKKQLRFWEETLDNEAAIDA